VIDVVNEITPTLTLRSDSVPTTQHQNIIKRACPRHNTHHIIMKRCLFGERYSVRFCSSLGPWQTVSSDLLAPRASPSTSASHGLDTLGTLASLLRRTQGSSLHIETHIDPIPACKSTLNKLESVVLWMFPRRDVINGPSPKRSDNGRTRNISRVSSPFVRQRLDPH